MTPKPLVSVPWLLLLFFCGTIVGGGAMLLSRQHKSHTKFLLDITDTLASTSNEEATARNLRAIVNDILTVQATTHSPNTVIQLGVNDADAQNVIGPAITIQAGRSGGNAKSGDMKYILDLDELLIGMRHCCRCTDLSSIGARITGNYSLRAGWYDHLSTKELLSYCEHSQKCVANDSCKIDDDFVDVYTALGSTSQRVECIPSHPAESPTWDAHSSNKINYAGGNLPTNYYSY